MAQDSALIVAKALRPFSGTEGKEGRFFWLIVQQLCNELAKDNPKFDKTEFYREIRYGREVDDKCKSKD